MTTTGDVEQELAWEEQMIEAGIEKYRLAAQEAINKGQGDDTQASRKLLKHYVLAVAETIASTYATKSGRREQSWMGVLRAFDPDVLAMVTLKAILSEIHNPNRPLASVAGSIGVRIEDEITMQKFHSEHAEYYEETVRRLEQRGVTNRNYMKNSIKGSFRNQKGILPADWSPQQRQKVGQICVHAALEACDLFELRTVAVKHKGGTYIVPTAECLEWIKEHDEFYETLFPERMPMKIVPDDWENVLTGGYIHPQLRKMTPMIIHSPMATASGDKWAGMYMQADMPRVLRGINAMQRTGWTVNQKVLDVFREVWHKNLGIGMPPSEPYEFPKCPLPETVKVADVTDPATLEAFNQWKAEMRELHELEAERKAKIIGAMRSLKMANNLTGETFYYVYRADFRGRVYCATTGLSPQGTDIAKGLLQFSKAKRLGERGWYWLRVSGANKYGMDKVSFDDRVAWIEEHRDKWLAVASDPIEHREHWKDAGDPYQFLAFCFEYADALVLGRPHDYYSKLPVGMDGSCNGLQHYSAILRDHVGGIATNLTPSANGKPADIYQAVADVLTDKLESVAQEVSEVLTDKLEGEAKSGNQAAKNWLALFAHMGLAKCPRTLSKKPVMTLPYGSTERKCCDSIALWIRKYAPDFFPARTAFSHALYLSPLLWKSIGEVVVAAREAMAWIRKCAKIVSMAGSPIRYNSVLGFPVKLRAEKIEEKIIKTHLNGDLRVTVGYPTGELNARRMQNGSAPHFVHNCDSSHMLLTVNACLDDGIDTFAMIHDDFGTHAADIDALHRHIREQFYALHSEHDVLAEFKEQVEATAGVELPPIPAKGSLDLRLVLRSEFFFS